MPPQQTLNERVEEFKRDLDTLDSSLDLIKREYEMFFSGARKRPPFEMRTQIERLLRKWRSSTLQKYELQFRLNTLNAKYNSMVDIWDKIMKRRESDPRAMSPYGPSAAAVAEELAELRREREKHKEVGPTPPSPMPHGAHERPSADPEARMRRLFDQYVDAKKDLGEAIEALSFQRFKSQIEKQTSQIREKTSCKDVEFGVVRRDGKVTLTAKPVK